MPTQIKDLGYENYISLINTGSLSLFFFFYVAQVALVGVLFVFLKYTRCHESRIYTKVYEFLLKGLFFDSIVALSLDAYFEFLVSSYL
jgi:hypothetical protein